MSRGKSLFALLATIFALSSAFVNGAILEKRQAAPPPSCTPWATCVLFFQDVFLFHWPERSQNTSCLFNPQTPDFNFQVSDIQTQSIYAVFESIRASDGCNTVGTTFAGLTTSFPSGALSSIRPDSSTYSFNFGDLPCPPPGRGWDPSKGQYKPQLDAPDFLFKLDPAFAACTTGYSQGIDPYYILPSATAGSGPGGVGDVHGHRRKRAVERSHLLPWTAHKTAEPTS